MQALKLLKPPGNLAIIFLLIVSVAAIVVLARDPEVERQPFSEMRVYNVITGYGENTLNHPTAVTLGLKGEVFVADADNKRIVVFQEDGRYLYNFGGPGSGLAEIAKPADLATGPDGSIYVADVEKKAVIVFNSKGGYLYRLVREKAGEFRPSGVTVDEKGRVFIFNEADGFFYMAEPNEKSIKRVISGSGKESPFQVHGDLGWDPDRQCLFTVDVKKKQVVLTDGSVVKKNWGDVYLTAPGGIAYDRSHRWLFVSDSLGSRIVVFKADGSYLGDFGNQGEEKNSFNFPEGLAMDQRGKLYVADRGNNRIVIYEFK